MSKGHVKSEIPNHIAIIMDGNGRWAKKQGKPRIFGHREGVRSVRRITEAAAEIGVKHLTLYAFSTENWNRPKFEVNALMTLLVDTLKTEIDSLHKNNIKLNAIGDIESLPFLSKRALLNGIEKTKNNTKMTLNLALNYSAQLEIVKASKAIAEDVKNNVLKVEDINENIFQSKLYTKDIPNPDLLIRTSGETRISNFLLWQIAYAELYFTPVLWPEFGKEELLASINDFQNRERRYGQTSEQIAASKKP